MYLNLKKSKEFEAFATEVFQRTVNLSVASNDKKKTEEYKKKAKRLHLISLFQMQEIAFFWLRMTGSKKGAICPYAPAKSDYVLLGHSYSS